MKFGQLTVAADGTKILAHASKHSAVSYARAGEQIALLETEVQQLLAKAEQADATPLQDGLTIPAEITRRQERRAALAQARAEIQARAQARYAVQLAEHEARLAARAAPGKNAVKKPAANHRKPPRPDLRPRTNTTSPTRRAGS